MALWTVKRHVGGGGEPSQVEAVVVRSAWVLPRTPAEVFEKTAELPERHKSSEKAEPEKEPRGEGGGGGG